LKPWISPVEKLLIADNFEQIINARRRCRSFWPLHAADSGYQSPPAEYQIAHEFKVSPLDIPPTGSRISSDCANPSVQFQCPCPGTKPVFALTDENVGPVAEICRRLTVYLWLSTWPHANKTLAAVDPRPLAARVESFDGLNGYAKHQQTMLDTIRWSYELPTNEQILFAIWRFHRWLHSRGGGIRRE
jgi:hypothetical protein